MKVEERDFESILIKSSKNQKIAKDELIELIKWARKKKDIRYKYNKKHKKCINIKRKISI